MSQLNPWLCMWFSPRKTIRWVVDHNPKYGVIWLSGIYVLQSLLFYLNFWSLGLRASPYVLLIPSLLLSPALGFVWVMFYGWILRFTGRWLGGKAFPSHVRAALAWSRLPLILSLLVWLFLWKLDPKNLFIQYGPGLISEIFMSSLFLVEGWAFVLFVQSLSVIQDFGITRTIANIFISRILYTIICISVLIFLKSISLYLPFTSKTIF